MPGLQICLMRCFVLAVLALFLGSCTLLRDYRQIRKEVAAREKLQIADPDSLLLWSAPEDVTISNPVCDQQGAVYVCGSDSRLYAIDQAGNLKWTYELGGRTYSRPALGPEGIVYIGCRDQVLYAISPDGKLKWSFETAGRINSTPAIGPAGAVFIGSGDGKLYALNPDGSLRWFYTALHGVWSSPAVDVGGTVYFGCGDLYAINPDGSLKWKFATEWRKERAYTTGKDGQLYLTGPEPALGADGHVYFCWNSRMYQVDGSGKLIRKAVQGRFTAVYMGGPEGAYYVVDKIRGFPKLLCLNQDGSTKWSFQAFTDIKPPAIGRDGTVYIGSGDLRAIGIAGAEEWWLDTANGKCGSPAIGADGTIYVCSSNELYAIPQGLAP